MSVACHVLRISTDIHSRPIALVWYPHKRRRSRWKMSQGYILCKVHVWKWPVVEDKHIKMKPRIYVLFVFDLAGESKFIKNKTLQLLKKYVLGCHLSAYRISSVFGPPCTCEIRKVTSRSCLRVIRLELRRVMITYSRQKTTATSSSSSSVNRQQPSN